MAKLFFVYAPPLKGVKDSKGKERSKRRKVQPPYKDAPPMHCSVFYYWWEYLRRNSSYRNTCERGGTGRGAKLYSDFGDVHSSDFWTWWKSHAQLFAEPSPRYVTDTIPSPLPTDTVLVCVPLENKSSLSVKQFKRLIEPLTKARKRVVTTSRAKYPVAAKPHLPSLHQHLAVWDAKAENPQLEDWQLADIARVPVNQVVDGLTMSQWRAGGWDTQRAEQVIRRRKQLAVQRHLRIAAQYIDNVAKGQFPLREKR